MRDPIIRWHCTGFAMWMVLVILFLAPARGADFSAANQMYDQGRFSEAKQEYEQLIEAGAANANVFYNLGNTNFRLGSPGVAVLAYERALALDPAHPEARANLALVRRQTGARLWPESWMRHLFPGGREEWYVALAAVAAWGAVFSLTGLASSRRTEKTGLWLGAGAGAMIAVYAGAAVWFFGQSRSLGVVIAKEAEARLAPAESAGPAGKLPAGSQVRVLSERGDWVYCALPDASRGWLPQAALARVRSQKS